MKYHLYTGLETWHLKTEEWQETTIRPLFAISG